MYCFALLSSVEDFDLVISFANLCRYRMSSFVELSRQCWYRMRKTEVLSFVQELLSPLHITNQRVWCKSTTDTCDHILSRVNPSGDLIMMCLREICKTKGNIRVKYNNAQLFFFLFLNVVSFDYIIDTTGTMIVIWKRYGTCRTIL